MTATRNYRVDSFIVGLAIKAPVKVASSAPLILSGEKTVSGRALVAGDRVLVKDQADPIENGIYTVETSTWQRAGDFDGARDVVAGTVVPAYRTADGEFVYYIVDGVGGNVVLPDTDSITFSIYYDPAAGATPTLQSVTDNGNVTTNVMATGSLYLPVPDGGTLYAYYTDANSHISIGAGTGANKRITAEGGDLELVADAGASAVSVIGGSSLTIIGGGSLYNQEKTVANADLAGYGQFWVRDDAPCTPMFTDDAGTDWVLNAAPSFTPPLVLGNNDQIQFGDSTELTMEWTGAGFDGGPGFEVIPATSFSIFALTTALRLRMYNALNSGWIQFENSGALTTNTLTMSKIGGTSTVSYQIGAWNHNDNTLQRPLISDYGIQHVSVGSTGGAATINFENGNSQLLTLTENITALTLSNPPATGRLGQVEIEIIQDSVARTIAWPVSIDWDGGVAPDLSTTSATYLVHLRTRNAGGSYLGLWAGPFS